MDGSSKGPISIATISSGFEKGDFLVREEKGQRVYFDFFEEAFNYIAYKGYIRMEGEDEREWMDTMNDVHVDPITSLRSRAHWRPNAAIASDGGRPPPSRTSAPSSWRMQPLVPTNVS